MWNYVTPGIPDEMFERLPGIPLSKKETRLLIISLLRLKSDSLLWDIGAGTGTIPIECGLICPKGKIIAVERDEDVAKLIKRNSDRFGVKNIEVVEGNAPDCIKDLPMKPDRVCIEGGKVIKEILSEVWKYLEKEG
ncbi:MAG TPA: precorrin-6Y C5,15-methyltransferase subunit CbiT, partial [Allocoleopsis sp.]